MRKGNKYYILSIAAIIMGCLLFGLIVRNSIKDIEYEEVQKQSDRYMINIMGQYEDTDKFNAETTLKEVAEKSDIIIKGKPTGKRTVLWGCVLSEVNVVKEYKSKNNLEKVYIYEPIFFNEYKEENEFKGVVYSHGGYGLMNQSKEYILFLKEEEEVPGYKYLTQGSKGCTITNNKFGKFPISYVSEDYRILRVDSKRIISYKDAVGYEQIFANEQCLNNYKLTQEVVLHQYKD